MPFFTVLFKIQVEKLALFLNKILYRKLAILNKILMAILVIFHENIIRLLPCHPKNYCLFAEGAHEPSFQGSQLKSKILSEGLKFITTVDHNWQTINTLFNPQLVQATPHPMDHNWQTIKTLFNPQIVGVTPLPIDHNWQTINTLFNPQIVGVTPLFIDYNWQTINTLYNPQVIEVTPSPYGP